MLPNDIIINNLPLNEDINKVIQHATSVETLNTALCVKTRRGTENLNFSLTPIYSSLTADKINLICETLTNAFSCLANIEEESEKLIKFINESTVQDDVPKMPLIQILNTILIVSKSNSKLRIVLGRSLNVPQMNRLFLNVLQTDNTLFKNYILITFFQNYYNSLNNNQQSELLDGVFQMIQETRQLNILCSIYEYEEVKLYFCNKNDFWNFLQKSLLQTDNDLIENQVVYLLSQSHDFCTHSNETTTTPHSKMSSDFFTLLRATREKQLHLVEPALPLLNTIADLDHSWKLCIYKRLLNHTQNSIVYHTINHLFAVDSWLDRTTFTETLKILLPAMNKNEYSAQSNRMFVAFNKFCTKLNDNQSRILLEQILNVRLNPTSCWKLFDCLLNEITVTETEFQAILSYVLHIPHVYVRKGSLMLLITSYFKRIPHNDRIIDLFGQLSAHLSDGQLHSALPHDKIKEFQSFFEQRKIDVPKSINRYLFGRLVVDCGALVRISRKIAELAATNVSNPSIIPEWDDCLLNPVHSECVFNDFLQNEPSTTEWVLQTFVDPFRSNPNDKPNVVISIIRTCVTELMNMKKTLLFKALLPMYLKSIYMTIIKYTRSEMNDSFLNLYEDMNNIFLKEAANHCFVGQCLADIIDEHVDYNKKKLDLFFPLAIKLILLNYCTRKEEKLT